MKKIRVSKEDRKEFLLALKDMLNYFNEYSDYPFLCNLLKNYTDNCKIKKDLQRILIYNLINPPEFIKESKYFRPCLNEEFAINQSFWCSIGESDYKQYNEMKAERIKFIEYLINKYK